MTKRLVKGADSEKLGLGKTYLNDGSGSRFNAVGQVEPIFVQIARQIIEAIDRGDLRVGSKLPGEIELARQFDVSRASVREALSSLQFAGYLDSRKGSGTIVVSTFARGTERLKEPGLEDPANVLDVLEARLAIEPITVRQIAVAAPQKTVNQISKLIEGMALTLEHPELNARTDLGIHLALAKACPNPFLGRMTEQLVFQSEGHLWRQIRDKTWEEGSVPKAWLDQHIAIANALASGNPSQAEDAMKVHLLSVVGNIVASEKASIDDQLRAKNLLEQYS